MFSFYPAKIGKTLGSFRISSMSCSLRSIASQFRVSFQVSLCMQRARAGTFPWCRAHRREGPVYFTPPWAVYGVFHGFLLVHCCWLSTHLSLMGPSVVIGLISKDVITRSKYFALNFIELGGWFRVPSPTNFFYLIWCQPVICWISVHVPTSSYTFFI